MSDIEEIDRFAEPEMEGPLCDMLWADPLNEDDSHKLSNDEYQQFLDTDYVSNQVSILAEWMKRLFGWRRNGDVPKSLVLS